MRLYRVTRIVELREPVTQQNAPEKVEIAVTYSGEPAGSNFGNAAMPRVCSLQYE